MKVLAWIQRYRWPAPKRVHVLMGAGCGAGAILSQWLMMAPTGEFLSLAPAIIMLTQIAAGWVTSVSALILFSAATWLL